MDLGFFLCVGNTGNIVQIDDGLGCGLFSSLAGLAQLTSNPEPSGWPCVHQRLLLTHFQRCGHQGCDEAGSWPHGVQPAAGMGKAIL